MAGEKKEGLTGKQKAATLLIALGQEVAADVFKHLKDLELRFATLIPPFCVPTHKLLFLSRYTALMPLSVSEKGNFSSGK